MQQPIATSGVLEGMSTSPRETSGLPPAGSGRNSSPVRVWFPRGGLGTVLLASALAGLSPLDRAMAEASKTVPAASAGVDAARSDAEPADAGAPEAQSAEGAEPSGPTHRYVRIPKRNAFGIKPPAPPPPQEPEKEPPKDRPEFFLTGFTTVRGEKRAFVAYQPKGKPVQYPRALIPDEEVGIGDGVLKLVSIDPIEKAVTIAYNGEEIPLNFKDNAVKVTGGTGTAPAPGAPGLPPGVPPSALRGNQPPPPVMNVPGTVGGIPGTMGAGGFPGNVPMTAAPTVIGRGGAILSGGAPGATPLSPNAIQAGGTPIHNGIDVPAVAPAPDQYGGTVPTPISRIGRAVPPPPPAPFPGLPGP